MQHQRLRQHEGAGAGGAGAGGGVAGGAAEEAGGVEGDAGGAVEWASKVRSERREFFCDDVTSLFAQQ